MEVKSKITDEEFFASKAYRAYLMDITESATRRYKQPLKVFVAADHDDPSLAYTDMSRGMVYINACNEITWSKQRQGQFLSLPLFIFYTMMIKMGTF